MNRLRNYKQSSGMRHYNARALAVAQKALGMVDNGIKTKEVEEVEGGVKDGTITSEDRKGEAR